MTKRDGRVSFVVSGDIKEQAETIAKETGLALSEIGRRGLLREIRILSEQKEVVV